MAETPIKQTGPGTSPPKAPADARAPSFNTPTTKTSPNSEKRGKDC